MIRIPCKYCSKDFKNDATIYTHIRKWHYQEAVNDGSIIPRDMSKRKPIDNDSNELSEFDADGDDGYIDMIFSGHHQLNTMSDLKKKFEAFKLKNSHKTKDNEIVSLSDYSKAQTRENVPFLRLCLPNNSYSDQMTEAKHMIETYKQLMNINSLNILFNAIDMCREQGMNDETAKLSLKGLIENTRRDEPSFMEQALEIFRAKYSLEKNKLEGWKYAVEFKNQALMTTTLISSDIHLRLNARIDDLYDTELETEILFAEFYYMKLISKKIQTNVENTKMELLYQCFSELGL